MRKIVIASRGSELALWQANFVQAQLKEIASSAFDSAQSDNVVEINPVRHA